MTCFAQLMKPLFEPEAVTHFYNTNPIYALFDDQCVYLIEMERVHIISMNTREPVITSLPTSKDNSNVVECIVNNSKVFLLHGTTKELEVFSQTQSLTMPTSEMSCISQSGDRIVFCSGNCDVLYCHSSQFPLNPYRTNLFTEKICAIGSNSYGLVVIGTEKCRIHMMSIDGLEAYGAIELPIEPRKIVVTETFNIICIDMWDTVCCYTMEGKKLFDVKIKATSISSFSEKGRDFILAYNDNRVIAIDPIMKHTIAIARDRNIVGAGFLGMHKSICVATGKGFINMIPFYTQPI